MRLVWVLSVLAIVLRLVQVNGDTAGTTCTPYIVVVYPTDSSVGDSTEENLLLNAIDDQVIDRYAGLNVNVGLVSFNTNEEVESGYLDMSLAGNPATLSSELFGTNFSILAGSDWTEALADGPDNITEFNPTPDFVIFIASDDPLNSAAAMAAADSLKANGAQMIAIGVAGGVLTSNLIAVSGPEEGKDYIQTTSFATLDGDMDTIITNVVCCDGFKDNCGICGGDGTCDDGDACTINDMCNADGVCVGVAVDCPVTDSDPCTIDQCIDGACVNTVNTGGSCDDGDICTENDICDALGQCAGTQIECDDGVFCDGPEFCQEDPDNPGQPICITGDFPECSDGDPCTQDICDFNSDECTNPPLEEIGEPCGVTDTGPCELGFYTCNQDMGLFCLGNVDPEPEDCGVTGEGNGVDENCNGIVDDGCGMPCTDASDCPATQCFTVLCVNDVCEYTQLADGTPCDDTLACTADDTCQGGECEGTLACDDGDPCTVGDCDPETGGCRYFFQLASCDDGDACTFEDTCQFNTTAEEVVCVGIPVNCNDNNQCTDDSCDSITGECINTASPTGTACDDGDACTLNDTCDMGICMGNATVNCDDGNLCTDDSCIDGECFYQFNTLSCDDSNACTANDTCFRGACGGTTISCDDMDPCTFDSCDPSIGCENAGISGPVCDDGDLCTMDDVCIDGVCVGTPVVCDDNNECTEDACIDNACSFMPLNGTLCDDGDPCTVDDMCVTGPDSMNVTCAGTPIDCGDGNPCTTDICVEGICRYFSNTDLCDDLNACTFNDTCDDTICSGLPLDCGDDNECTEDSCDPASGCEYTLLTGPMCDDGDLCTVDDVCVDGICTGTQLDCNDNNTCTDDFCLSGQCVHAFNSMPCDDGDPCTNDTCSQGQCVPGPPMDCSDDNVCTQDFCDPVLGCQNVPVDEPLVCDDGDACTVNDRCAVDIPNVMPGTCVGEPLVCDDGNPCTNDTCIDGCCEFTPFSGVPQGDGCSDSNACTVDDRCVNGTCIGMPVMCDDGNVCTDGFCSGGDCIYVNNNTRLCDDGNPCTLNDTCTQGMCNGIQKDCNDGNACTEDICDAITGLCVNMPLTMSVSCDDGDACTLNDVCVNGVCTGTPVDCDDGDQCTNDMCFSGKCFHSFMNMTCDDGDPCTFNDICNTTLERCAGEPLVCVDQDQCTSDTCINGTCVFQQQPDGTPCDDGDPCTNNDTCLSGLCQGTPLLCDDSLFCNGNETCLDGQCISSDPPDCNDGDLCTLDQCSFEVNGCVNTPLGCIGEECGVSSVGVCELGSVVCNSTTGELSCMGDVGPAPNETCSNGLDDNCNGVVDEGCGISCVSVDDCQDLRPCSNVSCVENRCVYTSTTEPCDDLNACTINDTCSMGICSGTAMDCSDGNVCTDDRCIEGECVYQFNNATCDDNNGCTLNDHCSRGLCIGTPKNCDDNNVCTDDFCDCATGTCFYGDNTDSCDDGDICTTMDQCSNGVCMGLAVFCDDNNVCTTDTCDPATGMCIFSDNTLPCNDTDPCTVNDRCQQGTCSGSPKDCDDMDVCTDDICDPLTGECQYTNNRALCDDGDPCTRNDLCDPSTGACTGVRVNCDDDNPCTDDICDAMSGICVNANNTECCDDGDPCTVDDRCSGGVCIGVPLDCNDANPCTNDQCVTGTCINDPNSLECDDGDLCTINDRCFNGTCVGQTFSCDDGNQCTDDRCDAFTGNCTNTINNTNSCTDEDPCTLNDTCINGVCTGTQIDCDDSNTCTTDFCVNGDCAYNFLNGTACDDGDPCTQNDTCVMAACIGTPITCDDGNVCTDDFCRDGLCQFVPCNSSRPCDDNDPCTVDDQCITGFCQGSPKNCSDGNFCNGLEACNTTTGACIPAPDGAPDCSDGLACTQDICDNSLPPTGGCTNPPVAGNGTRCGVTDVGACEFGVRVCEESSSNDTFTDFVCVGNVDPELEDCGQNGTGNGIDEDCDGLADEGCGQVCETINDCVVIQCNDVICNSTSNLCEYTHNEDLCNDGDRCTHSDQCMDGVCIGIPLDCNDFNICTEDRCNATSGKCENVPVVVPCDDGDVCTVNDHCRDGVCEGTPFICDDNNVCTTDACAEFQGMPMCFTKYNNATCDDGDPCTLMDRCINGTCISDPVLCDDTNPCTNDTCSNGECSFTNNNLPCDDNDPCTTNDICQAGQCTGVPKDCSDSDVCTNHTCDSTTGMCVDIFNNATCSDGDACTLDDVCVNGVCMGVERVCDDGNVCTDDSCDSTTGLCQFVDNTLPCDDGDACTRDDQCNNGICIGIAIVCDDNNLCTDDRCVAGSCCHDPNSLPCNDDDPCTFNDTCTHMICRGTPRDCSDSNACTVDQCDSSTGLCQNFMVSGIICDDGDACTVNDTCVSGTCRGELKDCTDLSSQCVMGVCDQSNGVCVAMDRNDGTPCDDGDLCTENDECSSGMCAGTVKDCSTGNICSTGSCNATTGLCEATNNNQPCDDGNPCTIDDRCSDSLCIGTLKDCNDGNVCTNDTCNTSSGACEHTNNMMPCDDFNPCTVMDMCIRGICMGAPNSCSDSNPCTDDSCNKFTGECEHVSNDDNACRHPDPCIVNDMCVSGVCVGDPRNCNDGNPCTGNTCDPVTGNCVSINNDENCNDGDACTFDDRCIDGVCEGQLIDCNDENECTNDFCFEGQCFNVGNDAPCDDNNPCTDDRCDPATRSCVSTPVNGTCDDSNACTVDDRCVDGVCTGTPLDCDDNNPCTEDTCDQMTGTCNYAMSVGTACDDGDLCTRNDTCTSEGCTGMPVDCNDGNICTSNLCNAATGECESVNNDMSCDDSNECTLNDRCIDGLCTGDPVICDQTTQCIDHSCNKHTGMCEFQILLTACNDGDACTHNDTCINGDCVGTPINCDDGDPCTGNRCDADTGTCVALNTDAPCDDGDGCTLNDRCVDGVCVGIPVSCPQDTQCTKYSCDPHTSECVPSLVIDPGSNGAATCDDGNLCTLNDTCVYASNPASTGWNGAGTCVGTPKSCPEGPCAVPSCDPLTGDCVIIANGTACDDGNACTENDTCNAGECTGTAVDCSDGDPCTDDVCVQMRDTGIPMCFHKFNTNPCDDGNACTRNDTCIGGVCKGTGEECTDDNPCTDNFCNPDTGMCEVNNNRKACDDGDLCTLDDVCKNGRCVGTPKNCTDQNPCTQNQCVAGYCVFTPVADDTPCTYQSNLCYTNATCLGGACSSGPLLDCNDSNVCTDNTCDPSTGTCTAINNMTPCHDNNPCTLNDQCINGTCQGTPLTCTDNDPCTIDSCDSTTGECVYRAAEDGEECEDGNLCTLGDVCVGGVCEAGAAKNCSDGNVCTSDYCDPLSGNCTSINQGVYCDDGDPCTVHDQCSYGICVGAPKHCDDRNPCTADTCDSDMGLCEHSNVEQGTECSYGTGYDLCREDFQCDGHGRCVGTPVVCDNDNPCVNKHCDQASGECVEIPKPLNTPCDDGDPCTLDDVCVIPPAITSVSARQQMPRRIHPFAYAPLGDDNIHNYYSTPQCIGTPLDCDDGNPCTKDVCANAMCFYKDLHSIPCDDHNKCTNHDTCIHGVCKGTLAVKCSKNGEQCGGMVCNPETGTCEKAGDVEYVPCDDGNPCTLDDHCINDTDSDSPGTWKCVGQPKVCDDYNVCTINSCDPRSGQCSYQPVDDRQPCTLENHHHGKCHKGHCQIDYSNPQTPSTHTTPSVPILIIILCILIPIILFTLFILLLFCFKCYSTKPRKKKCYHAYEPIISEREEYGESELKLYKSEEEEGSYIDDEEMYDRETQGSYGNVFGLDGDFRDRNTFVTTRKKNT